MVIEQTADGNVISEIPLTRRSDARTATCSVDRTHVEGNVESETTQPSETSPEDAAVPARPTEATGSDDRSSKRFWDRISPILSAFSTSKAAEIARPARPSRTDPTVPFRPEPNGITLPTSPSDVLDLLNGVEDAAKQAVILQYTLSALENQRPIGEIYIALIGQTQRGKSSTINKLVGKQDLLEAGDGHHSQTRDYERVKCAVVLPDGYSSAVCFDDSPGLFDTRKEQLAVNQPLAEAYCSSFVMEEQPGDEHWTGIVAQTASVRHQEHVPRRFYPNVVLFFASIIRDVQSGKDADGQIIWKSPLVQSIEILAKSDLVDHDRPNLVVVVTGCAEAEDQTCLEFSTFIKREMKAKKLPLKVDIVFVENKKIDTFERKLISTGHIEVFQKMLKVARKNEDILAANAIACLAKTAIEPGIAAAPLKAESLRIEDLIKQHAAPGRKQAFSTGLAQVYRTLRYQKTSFDSALRNFLDAYDKARLNDFDVRPVQNMTTHDRDQTQATAGADLRHPRDDSVQQQRGTTDTVPLSASTLSELTLCRDHLVGGFGLLHLMYNDHFAFARQPSKPFGELPFHHIKCRSMSSLSSTEKLWHNNISALSQFLCTLQYNVARFPEWAQPLIGPVGIGGSHQGSEESLQSLDSTAEASSIVFELGNGTVDYEAELAPTDTFTRDLKRLASRHSATHVGEESSSPKRWDPSDIHQHEAFRSFFSVWGLHYLTEIHYGGFVIRTRGHFTRQSNSGSSSQLSGHVGLHVVSASGSTSQVESASGDQNRSERTYKAYGGTGTTQLKLEKAFRRADKYPGVESTMALNAALAAWHETLRDQPAIIPWRSVGMHLSYQVAEALVEGLSIQAFQEAEGYFLDHPEELVRKKVSQEPRPDQQPKAALPKPDSSRIPRESQPASRNAMSAAQRHDVHQQAQDLGKELWYHRAFRWSRSHWERLAAQAKDWVFSWWR